MKKVKSLLIDMPLPHEITHPNKVPRTAKGLRFRSFKMKKQRGWAKMVAIGAIYEKCDGVPPMWKTATAKATFYYRTGRRRDKDNANAWIKPYLDGIADSQIIVNDAGLTPLPPELKYVRGERPRVEIVITGTDNDQTD